MNLAREWTVFAGVLFVLMGVSLFSAARRAAEDALSWHKEWRRATGQPDRRADDKDERRLLVLGHRFAGLFFAGVGLGLLYVAATDHGGFPLRGGGSQALFGGTALFGGGLFLALNAYGRRRRAPRFLEGELLDASSPLPWGERVAGLCSRAMIALMLVFGARLLREGLR